MKNQLLSLYFIVALLVASNTDWALIKEDCRWCMPDKSHGTGNSMDSQSTKKEKIHKQVTTSLCQSIIITT